MRNNPASIALWLPRGDEHRLAASLGLCESNPETLRELLAAAREQLGRDMPGVPARVHRWHVWRVVRVMARLGVVNSPDGRAAAFAELSVSKD